MNKRTHTLSAAAGLKRQLADSTTSKGNYTYEAANSLFENLTAPPRTPGDRSERRHGQR
jgi:hypothetical protein